MPLTDRFVDIGSLQVVYNTAKTNLTECPGQRVDDLLDGSDATDLLAMTLVAAEAALGTADDTADDGHGLRQARTPLRKLLTMPMTL